MMTRLRLTLLMLAALITSGAAGPATPSADAIRAEVQQFMKAYVDVQNKVDATALMDMVSKKPGVASIGMGEITRGWDAIRTQVDKMVGSEGQVKLALGTIDVEVLAPNFALAFAPCTVTLSTEEGTLQLRGALTLVVEKSAGKWKVLHEHSSAQFPETSTEGN